MKHKEGIYKMARANWRILFIIALLGLMILAIILMVSSGQEHIVQGKADLSKINFDQGEVVSLDGNWEFYWDQLLTPEDFKGEKSPQLNGFMKAPGTWKGLYPKNGVATYRLQLEYPATLVDPALKTYAITTAYKIYANGKLLLEVGKVSTDPSIFADGQGEYIVELPKGQQELELIIQVANLNYDKGGLRGSPVLGSKKIIEQERMMQLILQLFFSSGIFIFAVYYLVLFLLENKNKTALIFSILCFVTATRSMLWGKTPVLIFSDKIPSEVIAFINYLTGFNLIPIMIIFILSIFPLDHKKISSQVILFPTLFFDVLLFTSPAFMSSFTEPLYVLILVQMIYIIWVMSKAVLHKRENSLLMFVASGIFLLSVIQGILSYTAIGMVSIQYMFIYGYFVVIMAMSIVQARAQANTNKKLILYNETLLEADRLKDRIMETEMSFLQAQIKPHFLYNALDAIANVCEVDGEKASELIVDLSIYLRASLEFNSLNKMVRIEKELEFVSTYFKIEQARFGEKIQLLMEMETSLDYQIPAFILQPLVENGVRHGISKRPSGGSIIIRGKRLPEGIIIEIEDDGIGVKAEKLNHLLEPNGNDQGVGLQNIHLRLLTLYGKGLEIRSEEGVGTCVTVFIPKGVEEG